MKPFTEHWNGTWPYPPNAGVGLHLVGLPKDIDRFVLFLATEGCHPSAALRIIDRICEQHHDQLTISSCRPIAAIVRELRSMGMAVNVIPPLKNWRPRFPTQEWDDALTASLSTYRTQYPLMEAL